METTSASKSITDAVNDIKKGIILVFFDDTNFSVYHECKRQYIIPTETVVYIDCRNSTLLEGDGLTNMLNSLSVSECDCNIRNIVRTKAKFGKVEYGRVA